MNLDETAAVDGELTQRLRNLYDAVREHRVRRGERPTLNLFPVIFMG